LALALLYAGGISASLLAEQVILAHVNEASASTGSVLTASRALDVPEAGAEFCAPYERERAPGESWTVAGPTGQVVFTLTPAE
jgi:hypothetical protein